MIAVVALLVVFVTGAMIALGWHWQLRTAREVALECIARVLPRPGRSPQRTRAQAIAAVRREAREQLYEQASAASPHVVLRVSPADLRELVKSSRPEALAAELTKQFVSPTTTVEVIVDDRLQPGWVRAHATVSANVKGTDANWPDATEVLPEPADLAPTLKEGGHDRHLLVPVRSAPQLRIQQDGVLGRGPEADVQCDHPMVSRQHAHLSWTAGGWTVVDLQSMNGTLVDGVRIESQVTLRPGQRIMFGQRGPEYTVHA